MTQPREQLDHSRLVAPRENGMAVVEPPFEDVGQMVAENLRQRAAFDYDFQGRSLSELSEQARAQLLAGARRWTAAYRKVELASEDPQGPIFLAGHQPELFHPGVWFKNFALGALAEQHQAAAVNLIIDSDTIKSARLPTLTGSEAEPRFDMIPFDAQEPLVPYEERSIVDRQLFADFGHRVTERIAPFVSDPLLATYWPLVVERAGQTDRVGYCLAQARHQLEGQWGAQTLEIPQSWVCQCDSFRWFIAHLIAQLPRFGPIYNQVVQEYRRSHHIRNAAHPAPDLTTDGPWFEAPLWVWTADNPQRRRLFARPSGREILVSDRQTLELRLPLDSHRSAGRAVEELAAWSRQGVKIRSRALITTLWARLALGDLFLHGIGGAKYDQVTDLLIERFFGLKPPGIMVVSATLHLPVTAPAASSEDSRAIQHELRELTFHPEKILGESLVAGSRIANNARPSSRAADIASSGTTNLSSETRELIAAKRRWIHAVVTPENAYTRWNTLRHINAALQNSVADRRARLLELQKQIRHALRARRVLLSREFGFCLYPEKIVREFLRKLLPKNE